MRSGLEKKKSAISRAQFAFTHQDKQFPTLSPTPHDLCQPRTLTLEVALNNLGGPEKPCKQGNMEDEGHLDPH